MKVKCQSHFWQYFVFQMLEVRDERTRTRIERTLVLVRVRPNMNEHVFFKNY